MAFQSPLTIKYDANGSPIGLTENNTITVSSVSATTLILQDAVIQNLSAVNSNVTADLDQFAFVLNDEDFTGSPLNILKVSFSPPSSTPLSSFNPGSFVTLADDGSSLIVSPESNVTYDNLGLHFGTNVGVYGNDIHWHLSTLNSYFVNTSGDTMTGQLNVPTVSATTYLNLPALGSGDFVALSGDTMTGDLNVPAVSAPFISGVDYIQFDTAVESTPAEGRITWDATFKTLIVGTAAGSLFRLGQEVSLRVRNKTGSDLFKGQVVYVSGVQTNLPTIALASASAEASTHKGMGILKQDIPHNQQGLMMLQGKIFDVNTNGFSPGDVLYLGTTPGSYTNVYAQAPNHPELIGAVLDVGTTDGSILVTVQHGYEINELHNVSRTPASATGQILAWNETGGYYAPQHQTEQITINLTNVSANDYKTVGKFKYSHNIERIDTVLSVTGGDPSINWSVHLGEDRTSAETTVSGNCNDSTVGNTLSTNTNITANHWVWATVDSIDAPVEEFTLTLHLRKTE